MGTVELSGMTDTHAYTLGSLTLVRVNPEFHLHLFQDSFVGSVADTARDTEDRSLYSVSETERITRIGIVEVDGVVAAELFGVLHDLGGGEWTHSPIHIDDSNFVYPEINALVSLSVLQAGMEAIFLACSGSHMGTFAGTSAITLGSKAFVNQLNLPLEGQSTTFGCSFAKIFRGQVAVRIPGSTTVTLHENLLTAHVADEYPGGLARLFDKYGLFPSTRQPTCVIGVVAASVAGTTVTVSVPGMPSNVIGLTAYFIDNTDSVLTPTQATITGQSGSLLTLSGSGYEFVSTQPFAVLLSYIDEVDYPGGSPVTIEVRNRALTFLTLNATPAMLYKLRYHPATGQLKVVRQVAGGHALSCGCPNG
jgi:hypothetical protein